MLGAEHASTCIFSVYTAIFIIVLILLPAYSFLTERKDTFSSSSGFCSVTLRVSLSNPGEAPIPFIRLLGSGTPLYREIGNIC